MYKNRSQSEGSQVNTGGMPHITKGTSEWEGWGTALKPALEPITVARKPISEKTVAENCLKWGVGGINIDGCRVGTEVMNNAPVGNKAGGNSLNMSATGMPQDAEGTTANGRFPANLIHDGPDEVVSLFPNPHGAGSASRFFYCAKASKADRNEGCEGLEDKEWKTEGACIPERKNRPFNASKNNHPTVKPTDLMRYLCRLVTPPSGIVLDPFMGSGSTGKAAVLEGFRFVGIEQDPETFEIAVARIKAALASSSLASCVLPSCVSPGPAAAACPLARRARLGRG
jgi:site-specific DNA-methyltransferase (adenine-specific)